MEYMATTLDDWLEEIGLTARAKEEGIEEGIEKTARNALARGLSLDVISDITGLDTKTITGLSAGSGTNKMSSGQWAIASLRKPMSLPCG
jgi:hypothetical protein